MVQPREQRLGRKPEQLEGSQALLEGCHHLHMLQRRWGTRQKRHIWSHMVDRSGRKSRQVKICSNQASKKNMIRRTFEYPRPY